MQYIGMVSNEVPDEIPLFTANDPKRGGSLARCLFAQTWQAECCE